MDGLGARGCSDPVNTQRRYNVYSTLYKRHGRLDNIELTLYKRRVFTGVGSILLSLLETIVTRI